MRLLIETLGDLWSLLDRRGRLIVGGLVLMLIVSGAFDMVTLVFLFGYLAALAGNLASTSQGAFDANPIAEIYLRIAGGAENFALVAGFVLIGIFLLKNLIGLATSFCLMRFAMKRYEALATRLFRAFLTTRYDLFLRRGTIGPQQILASAVNVFRTSFVPALNALSDIAIFVTMTLVLMLILDPALVLAAGTAIGAGGVLFLVLTKRLSEALGARRVAADKRQRQVTADAFGGLVDIRLGGHEDEALRVFARNAGEFALTDRRNRTLDMAPRAFNEVLLSGGIVLASLWFAASEEGLTAALSSLAVLGFAGLRMTAAMSRLAAALQRMRENRPERQQLFAAIRENAPWLLQSVETSGPRPGLSLGSSLGPSLKPGLGDYRANSRPLAPGVSGRLARHLVLEDVRYAYPGSTGAALSGVSLEIAQGQFVGICGPSGGGKSTLALVLLGLLPPDRGRVVCDGWDVFAHIDDWHANLGFVSQTPFLPQGTVREIVAFGAAPGTVDDARVWRALEDAQLDGMIRARPDGLETRLGEAGAFASGGERQRLAIARALYRDPEVLVLDEATAALDTATERAVSSAIERLSGKRTVIAIAHRLSTIREADAIHVVEAGRIAASGRYDELVRTSPLFRGLAHDQESAL
ncbi:MAG: ABC transporter ATP-binding protein [Pseudomonadota bacterium]